MILEAKNVLYSYKSKRDKIVLKNVSATFEEATELSSQAQCFSGIPEL